MFLLVAVLPRYGYQRKSAANAFSGDSGYLPIAIC